MRRSRASAGARKGVIADAGVDDEFAAVAARQRSSSRTGRPTSAAGWSSRTGRRRSTCSADRRPLASTALAARAEQHVDRLRRSADRKAVPACGTRAESRRRDRRAPHGANGLSPRAARGGRLRVSRARRRACARRRRARARAEPGATAGAMRSAELGRFFERSRDAANRPPMRCRRRTSLDLRRQPTPRLWATSPARSSIRRRRSAAAPRSCTSRWPATVRRSGLRAGAVRPRRRRSPAARSARRAAQRALELVSQRTRPAARPVGLALDRARARRAATSRSSAGRPSCSSLTGARDARSRRLPPRPGALGRGGLLHPRFRRGAGAAARGAADRRSRR